MWHGTAFEFQSLAEKFVVASGHYLLTQNLEDIRVIMATNTSAMRCSVKFSDCSFNSFLELGIAISCRKCAFDHVITPFLLNWVHALPYLYDKKNNLAINIDSTTSSGYDSETV